MKRMSYEWRVQRAHRRFFEQAVPGPNPDDCWSWSGTISSDGYGSCWYPLRDPKPDGGTRCRYVSPALVAYLISTRVSLEDIPLDPTNRDRRMSALHSPRCVSRSCCNPDHVRIGTNRENGRDKRKTGGGRRGRALPRLSDELAERIITEWITTRKTKNQIREELGVTWKSCFYVLKGNTHRHVLPEIPRPVSR